MGDLRNNPWLTGFPFSPAMTYPALGQPWDGHNTNSAPAYTFFTPGVAAAPTAPELNFMLNQRDNATQWQATHGLIGIWTVTTGGFTTASTVMADYTGLTVSFQTNPGDILVFLLNVQANGSNGQVQMQWKDGGGAFASVPNATFGAVGAGAGTGCANGATVGFTTTGGTNGQTTVVKGQAASVSGSTTYFQTTLTVLQIRPGP